MRLRALKHRVRSIQGSNEPEGREDARTEHCEQQTPVSMLLEATVWRDGLARVDTTHRGHEFPVHGVQYRHGDD